MSIVRFEPYRDLLNLHRVNRLFENFPQVQGEEPLGAWSPAVDIYETEKEIVLKADLPGISLSDVDVGVENNTLTLKGERNFEKDVKEDNYHRVERSYGAFVRTFTLPTTVNTEKIEAHYDNGVLRVTMPKREEARPKQIRIAVAPSKAA